MASGTGKVKSAPQWSQWTVSEPSSDLEPVHVRLAATRADDARQPHIGLGLSGEAWGPHEPWPPTFRSASSRTRIVAVPHAQLSTTTLPWSTESPRASDEAWADGTESERYSCPSPTAGAGSQEAARSRDRRPSTAAGSATSPG